MRVCIRASVACSISVIAQSIVPKTSPISIASTPLAMSMRGVSPLPTPHFDRVVLMLGPAGVAIAPILSRVYDQGIRSRTRGGTPSLLTYAIDSGTP
ncbi:hypothetical protein Sme01_55290 [Sphaerisporangium melleum]|uniref:Uncharacterized protein n=1 Tax=Sphaerisporangium melleum TaxID=321316 RepID=A0A917R7J9_9ACTN|nr:hypothetical protein GCM10007964_39150 [Sphaerisporangium melleum]GII73053.1 hypothetical protein Sme01_55290 [Sphaerisporangium melleum]